MKKQLILITLLFIFSQIAYTQSYNMSGVVKNSKTKKNVSNALIKVKQTQVSIYTDNNGYYSLIIPEGNSMLIVSAKGMQDKEVEITKEAKESETLNVFLDPKEDDMLDMSLEDLMNIEVVSASKQLEPIREVPVPVTVITDNMIEASGAQNLQELLITYVPGITFVQDHNEMNVSMRGVYASSQQKILIMLNGQRLNSRAYSSANPDYAISLNKVKQIEILRGPASSLYGNVALTAVINIITKVDKNGTKIQLKAGNFGQTGISVLHQDKINDDVNFLFWGDFYRADGEKVEIKQEDDYSATPHAGYAILGGVKDFPAYDAGIIYNNKKISILANVNGCKYIEPFSAGGATGEVYDYDLYRKFLGTGPGLGSQSEHVSMTYKDNFKNGVFYDIKGYLDHNGVTGGLVLHPNDTALAAIAWKEIDYGIIAQVGKNYTINNLGEGSFLIGTQVEQMNLYDSFFPYGTGGEFTSVLDNSSAQLLEPGIETIYSGFFQLKHKFKDNFILNLGLRTDIKDRYKGENISDLSPRLALIYLPSEIIDFKLSFAKSFVDAPYWYRYNSIASYKGSENLTPEHLQSFQFTTTAHLLDNELNWQFNTFYNKLHNIIYRVPGATGDEPRYKNSGEFDSFGIENSIQYVLNAFRIYANFTFQQAINAVDYEVRNKDISNIPSIYGNLAINYYPLFKKSNNLIVNATIRYIGKQYSPIKPTFKGGNAFEAPNNEVEAAYILNSAITLKDIYNFGIVFQISNILDTKYYQGGSVKFPYPQPGRWYSVKLSYKF